MGWLRRSRQLAAETDPVASWGERAAKLVLWVVGPSALSGLAVGAYGWITANPLSGIAFGFVAFAVMQLALTLQAIRRSAAGRGPFAEPDSDDAATHQSTTSQVELEQEIERLRTRIKGLEAENDTIRRDAEALSDELASVKDENEQLKKQPVQDEELKRRARRLTVPLFRFAKERDKDDPQHDPNYPAFIPQDEEDHKLTQAKARYDDATWSQYRLRYEGDVRALLDALERREWLDAEERKEIQGELDAVWRSPSQRIERVAARLDAFAKRL